MERINAKIEILETDYAQIKRMCQNCLACVKESIAESTGERKEKYLHWKSNLLSEINKIEEQVRVERAKINAEISELLNANWNLWI